MLSPLVVFKFNDQRDIKKPEVATAIVWSDLISNVRRQRWGFLRLAAHDVELTNCEGHPYFTQERNFYF